MRPSFRSTMNYTIITKEADGNVKVISIEQRPAFEKAAERVSHYINTMESLLDA